MRSAIEKILKDYQQSFSEKQYDEENNDSDILMAIFQITPVIKRENRQYWGRELGMIWQRIVIEVFKHNHYEFQPAKKINTDEPYDLMVGKQAIDTKYRIGSGDSGTLKKLKQYGLLLKEEMGLNPVMLLLREDNLPVAITACRTGGWLVLTGEDSFSYIKNHTGVDLKEILMSYAQAFKIHP